MLEKLAITHDVNDLRPCFLSKDFPTLCSLLQLLNFPDNWTASVDRVDVKAMLMLKGTSYRDRRVTRAVSVNPMAECSFTCLINSIT